MSIFKVSLNSTAQGLMDINAVTGAQFATSNQRSVYVMGPNKTNRLLKDGATFTDSNYWKRFAYPQVPLEQAFISVLSDDGSVYSDIPAENTFPYIATWTLATTYNTTNLINFVTTYGVTAHFLQITNNDASIVETFELNGNTNLTFTVNANQTQVFNLNELAVSQVRGKSASGTPTATIIASMRSVSNS